MATPTAMLELPPVFKPEMDTDFPHWFANRHSDGEYRPYPFIQEVGEKIAEAIEHKRRRIVVNMPPRVGKSHLISRWTPVWFLSNRPRDRVMVCCYGSELATDFGRGVRNLCRDLPNLPDGCRPSIESASVERWDNRAGGGMYATGVGGAIVGRGFHLGLIDDPYKNWQDAWSAASRRHKWDWFTSSFLSRAEPGATIIVLHTRWHAADFSGRIERGDAGPGWEIIRLPMVSDDGTPLCPERYDVAACEDIRRTVGESVWQAVYQQRPDLSSGGLVYSNFTEAHVADVPCDRRLPLCLCLDFNINPGMHGLIAQYDPAADRFNFIDEIHRPRMDLWECIREFCARSKTMMYNGEVQVFGDTTTGTAEITGSSYWTIVHRIMTENGIKPRMRLPAANPRVIDRVNAVIEALKDYRGVSHMVVSPRCKRLLTDFREIQKDEEGLPDKSEQALSHASDGAGYMIEYVRPVGGRLVLPTASRVLV